MESLDDGMKYNPKPEDWDTSAQFLPASDTKEVEKNQLSRSVIIGLAALLLVALFALITGLLVWHFHLRDLRIKKMYSGSLTITNKRFLESYKNPNSVEYKDLANKVVQQLKMIYSKSREFDKYLVQSTVQGFSEGNGVSENSMVAYYLSEFKVPLNKESALDSAMASMDQIKDNPLRKIGRSFGPDPSDLLMIDNVVSGAVDPRLTTRTFTAKNTYSFHTQNGEKKTIQSPGFPDSPYPPSSYTQWQLRADSGYRVKLEFESFRLEDGCQKDFIKLYDSLVPIEKQLITEKCGYNSPNEVMSFISSENVMLLTLVTNEEKNFPGFRAQFSQIPLKSQDCGGKLNGSSGTFTTPNFPSYYPPMSKCVWDIEVAAGMGVMVQFKKLFLSEPGQANSKCQKDYVEVNYKRVCGQKYIPTVFSSKNNTIQVTFHSDMSYVDRGFSATFETFNPSDPCPGKFKCANNLCISPNLKCDGWNDCGDMSDETNCVCEKSHQITCRNGQCKPKIWQCDGINDCGDNTDEDSCGGCKPGEFQCKNGRCISGTQKCNGRDDCNDGSDEFQCTTSSVLACSENTFKCTDNTCVSKMNPKCDGVADCTDGSDEDDCGCGTREYISSRIVGGQDSIEGEWPWQVSLQVEGKGHICGATVISNRWLVTAAHCVQDLNMVRYSQPDIWEVYFGLLIQGVVNNWTVKKSLRRIIAHPNYNSYTHDYDIALMELESPVTLNQNVWPICLPTESQDFPGGKVVWITGWGATREEGSAAVILQKAEVRIVNTTVCDQMMPGKITSQMLCAGLLTGTVDACQGDSGGPLSSTEANGRVFLAGVVSWGTGCARRNTLGVYTRVTKFRAWIKEKSGV